MFRGKVLAATFCASALIVAHGSRGEDPKNFQKVYEEAFSSARAQCTKLWSNHAFDDLRKKIPLGDEKPTFVMLRNQEKLKPRYKPIADMAIQTIEKCRKAWEPVYEMIPADAKARILNAQRLQDAKITELYNGKITFGEFNVALSELIVDAAGISRSSKPEEDQATALAAKQHLLSISASKTFAPGSRVALIIGNSNYTNLPKLANPANDAKSVADRLSKMGYGISLLLDSSEQNTRREIRRFAHDSAHAEAAIVYYAGHGAQVNGSNFLLPIDADVPRTEVDIQFSGLKVEDLVNSIQSNTKIIFLDACRDNPTLYKNLAKGRGSVPSGLAPASSSNFERSGGGLFIAYATDAGAIADDGNGKHSPFTDALLRNIERPISIDDMFSLVTKEVRLVTKNLQRPYKYASLENIFCLAPRCGAGSADPIATVSRSTDPTTQAQQSATDELSVAKATKKIAALEGFLAKYPDAPERKEIEDFIKQLKLSEFTEWTLYELGDMRLPYYVQINSIQQFNGYAALRLKFMVDPNADKTFFGKPYPDVTYIDQIAVYHCLEPKSAISELALLNDFGSVLYHYKYGDPAHLESAMGIVIVPGSVAASLQRFACNDQAHSPIVTKEKLAKLEFKSLASTIAGDGEIFYEQSFQEATDQNERLVTLVFHFYEDKNVPVAQTALLAQPLKYRVEVDKVRWKCAERKFLVVRNEFYSASNELLYLLSPSEAQIERFVWNDLKDGASPLSILHGIICPVQGAQK